MADLPSILGGMAQGFLDFGKSAVDLFGTGGASIADLIESARTGKVTTKNSDDFRKWLYDTNDVKDAAAKGLGTALNGVQTVSDYIPGIGAVTRNPLFNAGQGALGGLADEFKMYGKDYDLGRAGQRAAVGAGGALASTGLADALKGSGNALLKSGTAQGLARGAVGGAIGAGGYTAIDGGSLGDVANSALQGAGMGAALGGTMGALQDFKPAKTYNMALTDDERQARIANAQDMLDDAKYTIMSATPEDGIDIVAANGRVMELRKYINALENGYDSVRDYDAAMAKQAQDVASKATNEVAPESLGSTLANADMAVNTAKLTPEQEEFFKDSVLRDENGKLMRVYHSSPNKFTTFDDSKLGENTAYLNTAFGHFVTPDADFSSRFMDIDNKGAKGNTMELYANVKKPITHPYNADYKYKGADLDNIVENYFKATDGLENLNFLKQAAKDNGTSLYEAYVDNMDIDSDPFETAQWDREALMKNGYDAVELVEGLKNGLVNGSTDNTPISSYAIFNGNQLKDINNLAPTENPDIRYSKAAPGQSLEKTLANGDAEINRIGSADVAPVDPATLPDSLRMANDYINKGYIKDIEGTIGKPYDKMTDGDFLEYSLSTKKPEDRELFRQIIDDMVKDGSTTYKKYAESAAGNKYLRGIREAKLPDMDSESLVSYLANNKRKLSDGSTKSADAELSDRLGIGRSNTFMMDNIAGAEDAYGVYNPASSTMSLNTNTLRDGDDKISVAGHERLHSFQTESKMNRYDPEVINAYKDLRKELRASKAFKNKQEIKDYWGESVDYYRNNDEQEARMLQQYLENRGFAGKAPKSSNKVYHEKNVREFDNDKINPAFDKFMDKLRDMSKRGIALPALTALFGGGALMANQQKDKEEVR